MSSKSSDVMLAVRINRDTKEKLDTLASKWKVSKNRIVVELILDLLQHEGEIIPAQYHLDAQRPYNAWRSAATRFMIPYNRYSISFIKHFTSTIVTSTKRRFNLYLQDLAFQGLVKKLHDGSFLYLGPSNLPLTPDEEVFWGDIIEKWQDVSHYTDTGKEQ